MNLPDIDDPLMYLKDSAGRKCTNATKGWFNPTHKHNTNKRNNTNEPTLRYGFTAHALRHAYNLRAHKLGVTPKMIADSLGHGMDMNLRTYTRHEGIDSKIEGFQQEVNKEVGKQTEVQKLQEQLEQALKQNAYQQDKIKHLESENNELKTRLRMYKAIEDQL